MPVFDLSMMLMKTRQLKLSLHYVYENKGFSYQRESGSKRRMRNPKLDLDMFLGHL
jgi:hypothetical protein